MYVDRELAAAAAADVVRVVADPVALVLAAEAEAAAVAVVDLDVLVGL